MGGILRLLLRVAVLAIALAAPFGGAALAAPASQTAPAVVDDGTPADGELVRAANGTWSPTPTSFAYQWARCDAAGGACVDVSGATAATYRLSAGDVGGTVRVAVSADGSAPVVSATTSVVSAVAAASTAAPVVTGSANEGQTLSVSNGAWTGTDPVTFAYQWQRCGSYQQTVLGDSPAGYWRLSDAAGQPAADLSGLGRNGSYVGGATPVGGALAGDANGATAFSNGRVDVPGVPNSVFASGFSLEAWVKVNGAQTDRGIAGKWRYADGGGAMLWLSGNGTYAFVVTKGNFNYLVTTVTPTPGGWDHLVGTWDGQRLRLYRNGVAIGLKTWSGSAGNPAADFSIASYGGGQYLNGAVDDVAVYPRALSAADVKRHFDTGANECVDIPGATAATYAVTSADTGTALRAVVTGSNAQLFGGGAGVARSAITAAVRGPLASATTAPVVSGTAQEGSLLTASSGAWTGNPTSFAYQWRRCGGTPYVCTDVPGATDASYRLVAADVGSKLRVVVTATNAGGQASAASAPTAVVLPAPPVNAVAPSISGLAEDRQTLTGSAGAWTSSALVAYTYAWQRCDLAGGSCSAIAGATADHYVVGAADIGSTLRLAVTATNGGGSTTAVSPATGRVGAESSAPTVSITAPADGALLRGAVAVAADAADNVGVSSVRFTVDGTPLGDPDTTAPYGLAWDTGAAGDGAHVLRAVATDGAGNATTSAAVTVNVDNTAPAARVTAGPAALSRDASPSLAFAADEAGATFECALDGAAFAACTSPKSYAGLADGDHTFSVRASDAAGNTGATASRSWKIDSAAPDTTIASAPVDPTSSASATIAFTANEAGATFECSLDGAAFAACASPKAYSALADGAHSFAVRATDAAGNADQSPATASWHVDTSAPVASIDVEPPARTSSSSAHFAFSSEAGATLECSLDGGPFAACSSPADYAALADGDHSFSVRATDAAGNTGTAATAKWTVDTVAPVASITTKPSDPSNSSAATFVFSSESGATLQCALDGGAFAACTSPQAYTGLADGAHTFAVFATDATGNVGATSTYRWTVDSVGPTTAIVSGAADPSTSKSASFAFTSEPGATFACSLDGAAFAACTSPAAYAALAEGDHSFAVRASDAAGNTGAAATYRWTVDTVAPVVNIDASPADPSTSASPSFSFSSEPGATLECALDGAAFAACTSPKSYAALADGAHSFAVRATDAAGNTGAAATYRWTIDTAGAAATIDARPNALSPDASPSFSFSSEAGATFACALDGAAFAACTSPKSYAGLADGAHTFAVRATDSAGNAGAAATYQWTIDTVAPGATIDGAPADPTNATSAAVAFSSEAGATLECALDAAAFAPCTSPISYTALTEGAHSFAVRATDGAGNTGAAATYRWTVDLTAPPITLDSKPPAASNNPLAVFVFSSDPGARFECDLDGGGFSRCDSPKSYAALADGIHRFSVRATDPAGNVSSAVAYDWTVDTVAPAATVDSGPADPSSATAVLLSFSSEPGATLACALDGAAFAACSSPARYAALADGPHSFQVRATDAAGNTGATATYRWTTDTVGATAKVDSGPAALTRSASADLAFSSEAGATFQCALDGAAFAACTSPKSYAGLADGDHAFAVRATDLAGNTGAAASWKWTVDTTPPSLSLAGKPADPSNNASPTFAFTTEPGATLACSLDGAAFGACTSPQSYSGLVDGSHSFAVRATDAAGNTSAPTTYTWTLDTVAPTATIDAKPADPSKDASPSFSFSSEPGAKLECSLDAAAYAACSSPKAYAALADGSHSFGVRATDAAGNTSAPATYTWTLDTVAPTATIDAKPADPSNNTAPSFSFSSEVGAKLECSLDGAAYAACASPKAYAGLADGSHSFGVRATDAAGNTGAPATYTWTIKTVGPLATITAAPADPSNNTAPSFAFTSLELGALFQCELDGAGYSACTSPKSYTGLAQGSHTFHVRALDLLGNIGAVSTYTWTIDTTAPAATIVQRPADPSRNAAPSFSFSSEAGATFACSLDGAAFAACTSPKAYTGVADGAHTFAVRATDAAGNTGVAATATWTIDATAPTASLTAPAAGATVSGTVDVTASAADAGTGVAGVQFKLDGANLGVEDTAAPYTVAWDTTTATAGAHSLSAVVRDAAGNTGSAAIVGVTVQNTPPTPTPDPNAFKKVDIGGGFVDANTHNVVRTKGDRVYVFAADDGPVWQKTGQGIIHAYRADQIGIPTSFAEADALHRPSSSSSVLNKLPGVDTRLDINGIVHAVYVDNGFPVTINYVTFNTTTDKWGPIETIASSQDTEDRGRGKFALVLDNNEKPQVVFMKGTAIMYTNRNAGTWSTPVTIATSTKPLHPSLAFDSAGTLHLAWMDDACSTCGSIKYMSRSAAGTWSAVETAAGSDVLNNANADQGTSLVVTSTGRVCVNYLSAAPGSAVRVTCRAAAGTWNVDPLPTNIYAHTPQLYSRNDDLYVFLGHDVDINYGYTFRLAGQPWSPYKKLLAEAHDGSASTRWDPRRDNNPNVIDTAFFDEDILKTRTWIPEVYYMAALPN